MNQKVKERFLKVLNKHAPRVLTEFSVLNALEEFICLEKERLVNHPAYTPEMGYQVVAYFKEKGFENAKLIGSLGHGRNSNNDIDILLPDNDLTIRQKLEDILKPKKVVVTDWAGLFLYDTPFGDIDIFFSTQDFTYQ